MSAELSSFRSDRQLRQAGVPLVCVLGSRRGEIEILLTAMPSFYEQERDRVWMLLGTHGDHEIGKFTDQLVEEKVKVVGISSNPISHICMGCGGMVSLPRTLPCEEKESWTEINIDIKQERKKQVTT